MDCCQYAIFFGNCQQRPDALPHQVAACFRPERPLYAPVPECRPWIGTGSYLQTLTWQLYSSWLLVWIYWRALKGQRSQIIIAKQWTDPWKLLVPVSAGLILGLVEPVYFRHRHTTS
jgi:hypothetical protein